MPTYKKIQLVALPNGEVFLPSSSLFNELLKRAIKNKDRKLSLGEYSAIVNQHHKLEEN